MPITSYEDVKIKRAQIMQALQGVAHELDRLHEMGLNDLDVQEVLDVKDRLEKDNFKVLVIGEFKRGKSTFINALMGKKILPSYSTPCTAVINEVVYGRDEQATLYFKDKKKMPTDLHSVPKCAQQHILKYQNQEEIPPMGINVGEQEQYVAIPEEDLDKEQSDSVKGTPYSKVVLQYPIPLCRDGVELIDSPGLNENDVRTKVTQDYLQQADAILFVLRCPAVGSKTEMDFIENEIRARGQEDIFFIINAIDQVSEDEQPRLKRMNQKRFAPLTALGEKGIFFVSSGMALKAKTEHDQAALNDTGLPELEAALSEYLRNDRGREKLMMGIRPTKAYINKLRTEKVESFKQGLDQDVVQMQKKVEEEKPRLDLAFQNKKLVEGQIENAKKELRRELQRKMELQYERVIKGVPDFVKGLQLENKMTINPFTQKERKQKLEEEVVDSLQAFIQGEMNKWSKEELTAYMESYMEGLSQDMGRQIEQFYVQLDSFRYSMSGVKKPRDISVWERLAATAVGTAAFGPTYGIIYGIIGGTMGMGSVVKRSAVTWGGLFALAFAPLTVEVYTMVATVALIGSGLVQVATGGKALEDKYKGMLSKGIVKQMRDNKEQAVQKHVDALLAKVEENLTKIPEAMQKEIDSEQHTMDALLEAAKSSEQERKNKICELEDVNKKLSSIESNLGDLERQIQ